MGWGKIQASAVVTIRNYQEAKSYYDHTKPIRGHSKLVSGVPVRTDRRDRNTSLMQDSNNGDIYLKLFRTNILTWHKPSIIDASQEGETITIDASYNTMTTNQWINRYLPWGMHVHAQHGLTILNDCYVCKGPMTFKKEGDVWTLISKPTRMRVERLDRAKASAVRKQCAGFYTYLRTMCSFEITPEMRDAMKESKNEFARDLARFGSVKHLYTPSTGHSTHRINYEAAKRRYTECRYREAGAYYWEELPIGVLHRNMQVSK